MSQDLLTISQEKFELQLHKIPSKQLIELMKSIYELKYEKGKHFTMEQVMDIERKETKIEAEMSRRGYLTREEYADFFAAKQKMNFKKRVF